LTDVMDAVDGGRSRRLPVLVRFGVGEGAVSAEISGWARTSPRCTTRTGPGAIHRTLFRRRSEVVSDIQQDRRRHHREVRRAQGLRPRHRRRPSRL